jgi:hypothetical protein
MTLASSGNWGLFYFPLYDACQMSVASFFQDLKTHTLTLLGWGIGLGVLVFAVWWLLPDNWQIKYAAEYSVDGDQVVIERKPHNCDWNSAPLGSKHCHYDAVVTVYNQYGHIIEGPGLDKSNPPSDQKATKLQVQWQRVDD